MTISTARPCGVYVSVADLKSAVSGTQGASTKTKNRILGLMNQHWDKQDTVDVMLMAECFWQWQHEMTKSGVDTLMSFEFNAIMNRIKNDKLVPTVGRKNDSKN